MTKFILKQNGKVGLVFDSVCQEFYVEMIGETSTSPSSFSPATKDLDTALKTFNVWVYGE